MPRMHLVLRKRMFLFCFPFFFLSTRPPMLRTFLVAGLVAVTHAFHVLPDALAPQRLPRRLSVCMASPEMWNAGFAVTPSEVWA
jgi:hypothetical protein